MAAAMVASLEAFLAGDLDGPRCLLLSGDVWSYSPDDIAGSGEIVSARGRVDCHARLACSRRARGWQYSRRRVARIHRPIGQLGAQVFLLVFEISQGVASWMTCRVTRLPLREPPEANGRSGGVANGIRTRDTQIHNLVL